MLPGLILAYVVRNECRLRPDAESDRYQVAAARTDAAGDDLFVLIFSVRLLRRFLPVIMESTSYVPDGVTSSYRISLQLNGPVQVTLIPLIVLPDLTTLASPPQFVIWPVCEHGSDTVPSHQVIV